ncbi:MAG: hypothetical protein IPK58_13885 [Acidobacteria bacterium]|nr:hypothetical protein [Acidobacteriota bacterium]
MQMVAAKSKTPGTDPVKGLIEALEQGIRLIDTLDDDDYTDGGGVAAVGVHFRHNLDFVSALLAGLETGRIDYGARVRDETVARERLPASKMMLDAVSRLKRIGAERFDQRIEVRSEANSSLWCESSGLRELDFVMSHTIHHYALIALKLAARGITVAENFGVAPSTIEFWNDRKPNAGEIQ